MGMLSAGLNLVKTIIVGFWNLFTTPLFLTIIGAAVIPTALGLLIRKAKYH